MKERDMMYGGYYGGIPGNNMYGNFGFQGPPGALLQMQNPYINNNGYLNGNEYLNNNGQNNSYLETNPFVDINNRLNELEIKVNNLEQKLNRYKSFKEEDDSIYML